MSLIKITCPNCGSPIEESQLKAHQKIIRCVYCNQTFKRELDDVSDEDVTYHYIRPCLSDEDCKRLIIKKMVNSKNVPTDIFDTLKISSPVKKMYPFYLYDFDWTDNWAATFYEFEYYEVPTYDSNGQPNGKREEYRKLIRNGNGTSSGVCDILVFGGMEKPVRVRAVEVSYRESLRLEEVEEFEETLEGWIIIDEETPEEVYEQRELSIESDLEDYTSDQVKFEARQLSGGWSLDNVQRSFRCEPKGSPFQVYLPLWEMQCQYKDTTFDAVVTNSRDVIIKNLPENTKERQRVEELTNVIYKNSYNRNFYAWGGGIAAFGAFLLWVGIDTGGDAGEIVFVSIILFVGLLLLVIGLVRTVTADNALTEKNTILSNSKETRRQAALNKYGSDPELVKMLQ